jgi:hypothetical protein
LVKELTELLVDSTMFEMHNMLQSLPPPSIAPGSSPNMDGVFGILRVLMVSKRERDIEFKLKDRAPRLAQPLL